LGDGKFLPSPYCFLNVIRPNLKLLASNIGGVSNAGEKENVRVTKETFSFYNERNIFFI
jgi:hypothetical protein